MAGDRHGKHNTTTISFRVNSYEKATIEERVKVSGMKKQDYIVRSCIYNHVCVVGKKETIEIIRSEMREMSLVLEDVAKDLKSEKPLISEPALDSMTERYLMVCIISRDSASWTGQVILQKKLPELHLSYSRKTIIGNIQFVVLVFEDVIWYQKRCLISLIYLWMKRKEKKSKRWTRW